MSALRILLVEDTDSDAELILYELKGAGLAFEIARVYDRESFKRELQRRPDVILSDYHLPGFGGYEALELARAADADLPFIFVSGTLGEEPAIESLKRGATDYVLKSERMTRLVPAIERAVRESSERRERRRLEDQYRQAQKMEAIGRLAGGVAHDFNNLLTAMLGLAELNIPTLPKGSDMRKDLEEIAATAMRAAELTKQLLTFSRKQIVEPRVVDLNEVIGKVEKMLRRIIGEDVELLYRPGASLGAVRIDPGQVEQLIVNLAVNARDAMPGGGRLTLETSNVDLDYDFARNHPGSTAGECVLLRVADTGVGMSEEVRSRIFEPFFTTKGHGTGLGLATCYGIVKQNGGYVAVDSAPGKGAVFSVYLPRVNAAPQAAPQKPGGAARGGGETILIVEDDERVMRLSTRILRERQYVVLEARSGEEAVRFIERDSEKRIRLVMTDVVMPKSGGREVARRVHSLRPELKFLYTSGYSDEAISHHGVLEEGLKFLAKPFTAEALARKIRDTLDEA